MKHHPAELHAAIIFKNFNGVVSIIDAGIEINCLWRGVSPVSCALYERAYNILEYLVKKGANVNIRTEDHKMEPPLFAACRLRLLEAVRILLQSSNLDIDQRDFFNRTPLWAATRALSLEMVELLLNHGAAINSARYYVECPLIQCLFISERGPRKKIAHLLIRRGCKLNFKYYSNTPLSWSVKHADQETFSLLVNAGCEITKSDWLCEDKLPQLWRKDDILCQWINSLQSSPRTLMHLSSIVIRKNLIKAQKNIYPNHVGELPLPDRLKSLILLED